MKFSKQGFIDAYFCLSKGVNTKQANQYILQLQKSQQAWLVAYQLLEQQSSELKIYGAQLFSKKVGSKLPQDYTVVNLIKFLLQIVQKNYGIENKVFINQLCLAICKLITLQKNNFLDYLTQLTQIQNLELALNIIKQLPLCLSLAEVPFQKQERNDVFKILEPYFIATIKLFQQLTIECLENFNQFCKINILNSLALIQIFLQIPLQRTEIIFNQCFKKLKNINLQPNIFSQIIEYVLRPIINNTPINRQTYIDMFLNFARFYEAKCTNFNQNIFKLILFNSLGFIENNRQLIVDNFQFWCDISIKIEKQNCCQMYINLAIQAFFELNKIVLKKSLLSKLISRQQKSATAQIFNLEQQQQQYVDPALQLISSNKTGQENSCLAFREYAMDYFQMCYKILVRNQVTIQNYYSILHQLTKNNQLQLQLCIFVLKSIADFIKVQEYKYLKPLLLILFNFSTQMSNDLLIPFLQLLSDCDRIILIDLQLLHQTLNFFLKTFNNPQISKLSSQTLSNIISSLQNPIPQIRNSIEKFLGMIYNQFQNIQDPIVLDHLTTSLICLIQKLDNSIVVYKNFLSTFYDKTKNFSLQKIVVYYQCLFQASMINFGKNSQLLLQLSELAKIIYPKLIEAYFNRAILKKIKKDIDRDIIRIFNAISKTCGRFIPQIMIKISKILLQQSYTKNFNDVSALRFFSNVLTNYTEDKSNFVNHIMEIWPSIKTHLINIEKRADITVLFIQYCYKLIDIQQSQDILNYVIQNLDGQFNYEKSKQIIIYLNCLIQKNLYLSKISKIIFVLYSRFGDTFSKSLIKSIIEIFKKKKQDFIIDGLKDVKPELLPPNPLYYSLIKALKQQDQCTIKNILLCLI